MPVLDLVGQQYGNLTVTELRPQKTRAGGTKWLCTCKCGNTTVVASNNLRTGHTRSCGCLNREPSTKTHGQTGTAEHEIWMAIRQRCYNPSATFFHRYGGRGIVVCERWRDSFENFLADMGPRPSPKHSIDRIDNDGPYSPENCRWATRLEQIRNRSNTKRLTYGGRTQTIAEWAEELGVTYNCLALRHQRGWSVEEIIHGRRRVTR